MESYRLKLYITGQTTNSDQAIENLRYLFDQSGVNYELSIVDVLEHPQLAEEDKVLATPTLIKISPLPVRRISGDLSNLDRVIVGLGLYNFQIKSH
jgi:circadian clock protein KaiB